MRPRYLMCAPDYFGVQYVINPWMEGHVQDTEQVSVRRQWDALVRAVSEVGDVAVMAGHAGVPDLVFTANAAAVLGRTAVLSSFRPKERQPEEPLFEEWLRSDGFEVMRLPRETAFEGAGDALWQAGNGLLWFGHGVRSDIHALPYLKSAFGMDVEPLLLLESRFYHLDTCFCPLEDGGLIYYPKAFDRRSQAAIAAVIPAADRFAVSDEDAFAFACNAISVGGAVILNTATEELKSWLAGRGMRVVETATSEFMKAGGLDQVSFAAAWIAVRGQGWF